MERFGDVYLQVVRFASEHQAEAFRSATQRCDFARRPVPQFGPPAEERAAFSEAALLWGFRTGAIRRVLKAFRNTPGSLTQQWSAARQWLPRIECLMVAVARISHRYSSAGRSSIIRIGCTASAILAGCRSTSSIGSCRRTRILIRMIGPW